MHAIGVDRRIAIRGADLRGGVERKERGLISILCYIARLYLLPSNAMEQLLETRKVEDTDSATSFPQTDRNGGGNGDERNEKRGKRRSCFCLRGPSTVLIPSRSRPPSVGWGVA